MKFIDALYGEIDLSISDQILIIPELQRLREVRLCNVNSPFITGGSNLNRFEHAIGTAFLAQKFSNFNKIDLANKEIFIIASLLHDIVTPPFGHSLEYLFDSLGKTVYEHAQLDTLFSGKTVQYSRPYYLGFKSSLFHKIDLIDTKQIHDLINGKHHLSKFLINNIDLDNIDNVFRFAFHIGIEFNKKTPQLLATNLRYDQNKLLISKEAYDAFNEWFNVRKLLYKYLLENRGEFAAKALLERVFIELINDDIINEYDWILTDYEFVLKALNSGNKTAKKCIQRYMVMDFPKYSKIFQINNYKLIDDILVKEKIKLINKAFRNDVFLHFIRDVNKTQRVLDGILIDDNGKFLKEIKIGTLKDRYLLGFFSCDLKALQETIKNFEASFDVELIDIYETTKKNNKQISLF